VSQPSHTYYAGRFRLDLPIEFTRGGEEAYVRGIEIREVTLPSAPSEGAAREAFWKEHVAEVRKEYRSHELPAVLSEGEFRPGVPKLSYRGYTKDDLVLESLFCSQGRAALIHAEWRQSWKPENRPAQNAERERAFQEVSDAFGFLPPGHAASDRAAFYLEYGAVRIPYAASDREHPEKLGVVFPASSQEMKLSFDYQHPWDRPRDRPPGLLQRVAKTVAEWSIVGRPIRAGGRVVAGFAGEEAIVHSKDDNKMRFAWVYEPPDKAAGFQPTIKISADSDDSETATRTALWDRALDGIHQLNQ